MKIQTIQSSLALFHCRVALTGFAVTGCGGVQTATETVQDLTAVEAESDTESATGTVTAEPGADPNELYNRGLRAMQSIEGPLRGGRSLSASQQQTAREAEQSFLQAIELAPSHGRAHIMLGMLYDFTDRDDEAVPHLERGMTLPEGSRDWTIAASTRVGIYFGKQEPAPAIPVLEKLVEHNPNDTFEIYRLGLAHGTVGDNAKARQYYQRVLSIDPNHRDARVQLNQLGR